MYLGTVAATVLAFSRCAAVFCAVADGRAFAYPDDGHVIVTRYGPAAEDARPPTGHYEAEVIPLDVRTWKPIVADGRDALFHVQLAAGYSVTRPPFLDRRPAD